MKFFSFAFLVVALLALFSGSSMAAPGKGSGIAKAVSTGGKVISGIGAAATAKEVFDRVRGRG